MQTQAGVSLVPSVPISPKEWSRAYRQRMKQDADLARFGRGPTVPLALLAQGTRTATANAGPIDHAQAPIGFAAVFMWEKRAPSRATQGSIRLEGKV